MAKKYAERLKFNVRDGYIFITMQFPWYDRKSRIIITEEVDFFIGKEFLVTAHKDNLPPLAQLFNLCASDSFYRNQYLTDSSELLFKEIMIRLQEYCYPILDHISLDIKNIEEHIFSNRQRQMIAEIMNIKRNILDTRKILRTHKNAIQRMMAYAGMLIDKNNKKSYQELLDNTKNIWGITEGQKEMIESLEETNTTTVSFRLNDIMKTLTTFSVMILPLSLLVSFFGISITNSMPFFDNPYGFWLIIILATILMLVIFLFFRRKKWL